FGAVRGVLTSVLSMIEKGATHLGVATDHVVESFRNDLYPGYKTSEGVPEELLSQFPIVEEALESMGVKVWPEVYFEADDALASAAAKAANDERVGQVLICTPDKDLSQSVAGNRVVQLDRRRELYPRRCSARGTMPFCFALWRPCGWTRRFLIRSRTFAGKDRDRTLRKHAGESKRRNCCAGYWRQNRAGNNSMELPVIQDAE